MLPYTYLLHHKPTDTWYYGVKWARGCHPDQFWVSYHTSSDYVALLRTLFGDESFEFEIRHTFKTGKAAADWEAKVLRRMRVLYKPDKWLNRTTNTAWLYDQHPRGMAGKPAWNKAKHMTEAQKAPMRKPKSDTSRMGKHTITPQIRANQSKAAIQSWENGGRDYTHIKSLATQHEGSVWVTNGVISHKVSKNAPIPTGYWNGRHYAPRNRKAAG